MVLQVKLRLRLHSRPKCHKSDIFASMWHRLDLSEQCKQTKSDLLPPAWKFFHAELCSRAGHFYLVSINMEHGMDSVLVHEHNFDLFEAFHRKHVGLESKKLVPCENQTKAVGVCYPKIRIKCEAWNVNTATAKFFREVRLKIKHECNRDISYCEGKASCFLSLCVSFLSTLGVSLSELRLAEDWWVFPASFTVRPCSDSFLWAHLMWGEAAEICVRAAGGQRGCWDIGWIRVTPGYKLEMTLWESSSSACSLRCRWLVVKAQTEGEWNAQRVQITTFTSR